MSDCYPERFTRAYVYEQTAERVELHFRNNVTVRHVTNKGCILLAVLWAKILQHRGNFPNHIYRYDRTHHQVTGHELLRVHIPDTEITFTVTMATGLLTIEGLDVFRWFRNKFLDLLKNYDEELYNKLHPLPPLTPKKSRKFEKKETPEPEKVIVYVDRPSTDGITKPEDLSAKLTGVTVTDLSLLSGHELDAAIKLYGDGSYQDGFSVVYRLWRSLINRWFCDKGTQVYIATPRLDIRRLKDVCDLYVVSRQDATLHSFFVNPEYRITHAKSLQSMQENVLVTFDTHYHTDIDNGIFKNIVYPWRSFGASFIAGVKDGLAKVMVTSAKFHGKYFTTDRLETITVLDMPETEFESRYLTPLSGEKTTALI